MSENKIKEIQPEDHDWGWYLKTWLKEDKKATPGQLDMLKFIEENRLPLKFEIWPGDLKGRYLRRTAFRIHMVIPPDNYPSKDKF